MVEIDLRGRITRFILMLCFFSSPETVCVTFEGERYICLIQI